jgi:hypothetical protein
LHIFFETAPNLLENIALVALKFYACKCMDPKQLWGEECQVVIVSVPRYVVGSPGKCVWLTHALAWLVVKCEVEVR